MTQLTVVAKITAKSGFEDLLRQSLMQLIAPTLEEDGCLNYDLHSSIEDKTLFLFYENWESRAMWEKHMDSEHIQAFQRDAEGLLDNWELLLMKLDKPID